MNVCDLNLDEGDEEASTAFHPIRDLKLNINHITKTTVQETHSKKYFIELRISKFPKSQLKVCRNEHCDKLCAEIWSISSTLNSKDIFF